MSAMWSGRLERFSPLRCRASRSMEYMSPTSSRRLAKSMSRNVSSSLVERPARFLAGLRRGGAGGGMIDGTEGEALAALPLAGLIFVSLLLVLLLIGLPLADFSNG